MICPKCGKEVSDAIPFCELCGATLPKPQKEEDCAFEGEHEHLQEMADDEPKPLMGFLGALIGSVLSCVITVLLQEIGLISAYGGILIPFLIFIGSKLLNKNRTKIGVGVCVMFLLVTPYFADRATWALWLMDKIKDLSFMDAFLGMTIMLDAEYIDLTAYFAGLMKIYIFTAAGAVAYFAAAAKAKKRMK